MLEAQRNGRREQTVPGPVRCAIYTRKSTEEGLEQEFNSLDAQRESAEAFIASQRHLGWTPVVQRYDDGGYSGGTLERPALRQLLADIEAGLIDCVVVYKVDRLSRSLLDFTKLLSCFEQRKVSFVSVMQQFNTSNSLGRLTLNILLSFAEFERDLVRERTRDKMGAARRKGKWVGGTPLLGYDVAPEGGRLIVNKKEALKVREIFELYQGCESLAEVVAALTARGWCTKSWKSRRGKSHPGKPFTKASLRLLLTNATYAGLVVYRGVTYQGEHPAIIDKKLWDEINAGFQDRRRNESEAPRQPQNALLAGRLFCESCQRPMIATYSAKGQWRFRYYVWQRARQNGWRTCPTKSISAKLIEESLVSQLATRLNGSIPRGTFPVSEQDWSAFLDGEPAKLVDKLIEHIQYDGTAGVARVKLRTVSDQPDNVSTFEYALSNKRNRALPVFQPHIQSQPASEPAKLARVVALAHQMEACIRSGEAADYGELARRSQVSHERIAQIVILAQLAPDIQEYVLFLSAQHAGLISELALRNIAREPRWDRQRAQFRKLTAQGR